MTILNAYSSDWFDIFLETYPTAYTEAEIEFITQYLPLETYSNILDLCSGSGRHALLLANLGYYVTGIDNNPDVIEQANRDASINSRFLLHDMRELPRLNIKFDGVINMWQSWGYFDESENIDVLKAVYDRLNPGGRFIIDIYNREFFVSRQGEKRFERAFIPITERKTLDGKRLTVELDYGEQKNADVFSWLVYTPDEFEQIVADCGFTTLVSCRHVNPHLKPADDDPRMQFVLQK